MKPHSILVLVIFTMMFTACSDKPKSEQPISEKPKGVLTDAQQRTLDRAKQTEEVIKKADEERLKKIDEITAE